MLFAVDIGNSAVKTAFFDDSRIEHVCRLAHGHDLAEHVLRELHRRSDAGVRFDVVVCSVVPDVQSTLTRAMERQNLGPVHTISGANHLPVRLAHENPLAIGADRIAAVSGAVARLRRDVGSDARPVLVVDAGTATTFNAVDAGGVYVGGMIWAGPDLVARALHANTAQLPIVDLDGDLSPIATETSHAIRAAARIGFVEGVRGIIRRMTAELGLDPILFVTGGRASLVVEAITERDVRVDPHLVLNGIREIAVLNGWTSDDAAGLP